MSIPDTVRAVIESGRLSHLVTLNPDGSPQITCVWVGMDGAEIVSGHLGQFQKLRNVQRDSRVALSMETDRLNPMGLLEYLVVYGHARMEDGGGSTLLQRLASVYIGPDATFPPMDSPPDEFILRITPERFAGVGPWSSTMR